MRIFLSYASEDRASADAIRLALEDDGHDVFFDREDLPPGDEFHNRIRSAIEKAQLVIFLVSARTLDAGSYTLNEIAIAEKSRPAPAGHVLPVLLEKVDVQSLPAYLRSVTFLETPGNVTAAVADAVCRIARERRRRRARILLPAAGLMLLAAAGIAWYLAQGRAVAESNGKDGAPLVLVPAGNFVMGDDESWPKHPLYLDAYYIDRLEVTTARYAKFLSATGSNNLPDGWDEVAGEHSEEMPVIGVSWNDANAYCHWAGRRLPTEAEWEKAARGTDERQYPWGNVTPTIDRANFENSAPGPYEGALSAVGSHPGGRSPYGVEDMAGNAAEWVADWYSESFSLDETFNPKGRAEGEKKVIRGGGRYDPGARLSAAARQYASPDTRGEDIGFRCARDP
jgi:formylglycine-generating enzyme required for sulfatase activity